MMSLKEEPKNACGMLYRYELTSQVIDWEDGMKYTTYGIIAKNSANEAVETYPDISLEEADVRSLVDKCNQNELDVIHLEDVVLDCIS